MMMIIKTQKYVTYSVYHYGQAEFECPFQRPSGKVSKSQNLTSK